MNAILSSTQLIHGVPQSTILLLLLLPIIATFTAFVRQIIGIKSFSAYTPIIMTFAFIATGVGYGLLIALIVYCMGTLLRILIRDLRLHYLPRISLMLTIISFTILLVLFLTSYINESYVTSLSLFPLLLLITLGDIFISTQIQKGLRTATFLFTETIITSLVAFFIVTWEPLDRLILDYPAVIFITIILNIFIGRWTGLRLSEYWRFRKILK